MPSPMKRCGFTLIELLVVITIIGVLIGLLLPAISSARAAGRRAQCANNMRNLGVGILGYVTTSNKFPPQGVISDDPMKSNPGSPPINVPRNQGIVSWLDPACLPDASEVPMYNWVVEILAFGPGPLDGGFFPVFKQRSLRWLQHGLLRWIGALHLRQPGWYRVRQDHHAGWQQVTDLCNAAPRRAGCFRTIAGADWHGLRVMRSTSSVGGE